MTRAWPSSLTAAPERASFASSPSKSPIGWRMSSVRLPSTWAMTLAEKSSVPPGCRGKSPASGSPPRTVVVTRSPLTEVYIETYIGGNIGHDLRKAGWDGLFITGASESWVRLEINDASATLHPAQDLVGRTTWEVEQALDGLGECLSIGPAGENGIRIASPLTAGRRAAGRGGTGASFGFKRLKAVTVKASKEAAAGMRYAEDFSMAEAIKQQRSEMGLRRKSGDPFYAFGTSRGPLYAAPNGRMPTANYASTDAQIPDLNALKVGGGAGGQTPAAVKDGAQAVTVVSSMSTRELSGEHWHASLPDAKQGLLCAVSHRLRSR